MSKRKRTWKTFDFGPECNSSISKSIETRTRPRTVRNDHVTLAEKKFLEKNDSKSSLDFFSKLAPRTIADLSVHSKKIDEVQFWLKNIVNFKNFKKVPFLLLSGPTGSGKTATLNVLCKNMNISILEWINPVDHDYEVRRGSNQIDTFLDFLIESKYSSLFENCTEKIVSVKDFPNVFMKKPEEFSNVLSECTYKCKNPIVFICTDSANNKINMVYNLFPQEIINKYQITHISFNACAPTLMKNCLRRAHELVVKNKDNFQVPSSSTVDAIIASSMGDIRCAINQYYFASLLGTREIPTEKLNICVSKSNKKTIKSSGIKVMTKNETLGLFHALGRILNPKRKVINGTSWRLDCDLENLIIELESQPDNVINFLFANYLKYFGDLKDAQRASDLLSSCGIFLEKWYEKRELIQYPLWTSILGLMINNNHKVSKWNQIEGLSKTKITRNDQRHSNLDSFYTNLIMNKTKNNSASETSSYDIEEYKIESD